MLSLSLRCESSEFANNYHTDQLVGLDLVDQINFLLLQDNDILVQLLAVAWLAWVLDNNDLTSLLALLFEGNDGNDDLFVNGSDFFLIRSDQNLGVLNDFSLD